jgi:hypothetical protein
MTNVQSFEIMTSGHYSALAKMVKPTALTAPAGSYPLTPAIFAGFSYEGGPELNPGGIRSLAQFTFFTVRGDDITTHACRARRILVSKKNYTPLTSL